MILFSPSRWVKKGFRVLYNAEPNKIDITFYGFVFVSYIKMTKCLFCFHTQLCLFSYHNSGYGKHRYAKSRRDTLFISIAQAGSVNAVCSATKYFVVTP